MDKASLSSLSESALKSAVLRGEDQAWEALVLSHWGALARYVREDLAAGNLADEILQETWLLGLRRIGRFDPARGSFVAWMKGIAHNVSRDERRRAQRLGALQAIPANFAQTAADPDAALLLREALSGLDAEARALLSARYEEGLSLTELARREGRSAKAVESALTRARRALKLRLEQSGPKTQRSSS